LGEKRGRGLEGREGKAPSTPTVNGTKKACKKKRGRKKKAAWKKGNRGT